MSTDAPNSPSPSPSSSPSSSPWRRLRWEVVVFSLLAAGIYGAWEFQAYRSREALTLESARWTEEVARLEQKVAKQAGNRDARDVEVAFRTYAAGLAVTEVDAVTPAMDALLRVEEVRFVHLLNPDGTVIATSDRKLETLGHADERAFWSLALDEPVVRTVPGGGTEAAGPITLGGESAVLWLGWRTP